MVQQCVLAGVSRATIYAQQKPVVLDESELLLRRLIDEEYMSMAAKNRRNLAQPKIRAPKLTGDAIGFDPPGFYPNRTELAQACERSDIRWESRQTFQRQAARCASASSTNPHSPFRMPYAAFRIAEARVTKQAASDFLPSTARAVGAGWRSRRRRAARLLPRRP